MDDVSELLVFGVGVDVSSAEAGLASLGESGATAAAQLEDRLSGSADSLKELGKRSSTASRGIQGLAAVIGLVDPRLAQVVRSVGTLARGLSVLRLGLGPAAVAVTVVTTALAIYTKQSQAAAEAQKKAEERAEAFKLALEGVAEISQEVEAQLRLINGEIDQFGVTAETQSEQIRTASEAVVASYDEQIAAQQELVDAAKVEADAAAENLRNKVGTIRTSNEAAMALRNEENALRTLTDARDDEIARMEREIETVELIADFRRESIAAQEAEKEAARMAAEAQKAAAEAEKRRAERAREVASAVSELASIEREQAMAQMSDQERINFLLGEKIDRLQELAQITDQDTTALQLEAELLARQEIAEVERAQHEERLKRQEELSALRLAEHEAAMAEMQAQQAARMDTFSEIGEAYGNLATLAEMAAKKQATASEEAARRTAALAKRLGLFQIAIDTAVGLQKAITANAGNPIAAAAAIAAVLTGSAVQTATVASQTLHSGGNLAPDEQPVRTVILRDEAVTSRGQVLSPEETRSQSRGRAETVVIPAFQHFGQFFADVVEGGGTPLHDLIYEGRTLGRAGY
jgi:hypothetical protein